MGDSFVQLLFYFMCLDWRWEDHSNKMVNGHFLLLCEMFISCIVYENFLIFSLILFFWHFILCPYISRIIVCCFSSIWKLIVKSWTDVNNGASLFSCMTQFLEWLQTPMSYELLKIWVHAFPFSGKLILYIIVCVWKATYEGNSLTALYAGTLLALSWVARFHLIWESLSSWDFCM